MNINRVEFSGNLAADASQREAGTNTVTSFRIAVNPRKRDGKEEGETMWFGCSLWGKRGTSLMPYLKKGQQVIVFGELSQRSYKDKATGEDRVSYDINVNNVDFVSSGGRGGNEPAANRNDDLPF